MRPHPGRQARRGHHPAAQALRPVLRGRAASAGRQPHRPHSAESPEVAETVDRRVVASPAQDRAVLAAVRAQGARGQHLEAFYGCLYYAALRPSEAVALREADCYLPSRGCTGPICGDSFPGHPLIWPMAMATMAQCSASRCTMSVAVAGSRLAPFRLRRRVTRHLAEADARRRRQLTQGDGSSWRAAPGGQSSSLTWRTTCPWRRSVVCRIMYSTVPSGPSWDSRAVLMSRVRLVSSIERFVIRLRS